MENETKIPKIIHYIWIGGNEKTPAVEKCLASWRKYAPDYQIIEWNESNYDKLDHYQINLALAEKNYAYASDIMRVDILYRYGGIYFDTDLELVGNIDFLLDYRAAFSYEAKFWFGSAFLACEKNHPLFKFIYERYNHTKKIKFSTNYSTVHAFTAYMRYFYKLKPRDNYEVIADILCLPRVYFFPLDYCTYEDNQTDITVGIHHYGSSWHSKSQSRGERFAARVKKILGKTIFSWFELIFANSVYYRLRREYRRLIKAKE